MAIVVNDEIVRLIHNRLYDGKHPFRRGSIGMTAFAQVVGMLKRVSDGDVAKYVAEIEKIFETVKDCEACTAKLYAYLVLICDGELEDRCREYGAKLAPIQINLRYNRDYKEEVYACCVRQGWMRSKEKDG